MLTPVPAPFPPSWFAHADKAHPSGFTLHYIISPAALWGVWDSLLLFILPSLAGRFKILPCFTLSPLMPLLQKLLLRASQSLTRGSSPWPAAPQFSPLCTAASSAHHEPIHQVGTADGGRAHTQPNSCCWHSQPQARTASKEIWGAEDQITIGQILMGKNFQICIKKGEPHYIFWKRAWRVVGQNEKLWRTEFAESHVTPLTASFTWWVCRLHLETAKAV